MSTSAAMPNKVENLNALTLPLFGQRLIEASAGTGKTYTLAALYLRLLLGLGQQAAHPRALAVEEILVVTFTDAATEELRNRIRENIHTLRIACIRGESQEPLMAELLSQITDHQLAANVLLLAERQMDEAAIYTIHGFCQRMLTNHAFESGVLFEQQLVRDETLLQRQAVADFWRRYCYPLPTEIARVITQTWAGPEQLLKEMLTYLRGDVPRIKQAAALAQVDLFNYHQNIIQQIDKVKQDWLACYSEIETLISHSTVDKRTYTRRNLPTWLAAVTHWAKQPTQDYTLPNGLNYFSQSILAEKTKQGSPPQHAIFVLIENLCAEPLSLHNIILSQAIEVVRQTIEQEKHKRAEFGFDDLLTRLDKALASSDGARLAQEIRQRYPVAMIDEFQDTDPQQYRIFNALYAGQKDSALLLIGDPKQAIYSFRGADIFTYIQAKNNINAHYSMATNWRSAKALVESVNLLFERVKTPFIFTQIPYLPVDAAKKNHHLAFKLHNQLQPAMQFWLLDAQVNSNEYQRRLAQYCASQIRDWLVAGQQQQGWLVQGKQKTAISAQDIAILVRTRREAESMRQALAELAIPSVYLSNRDSVFSTLEAQDLLWILRAVLTPQREKLLRTALACSLLGLNAMQIHQLNHDEAAWEQVVDEFVSYRQCWLKQGILPMLRDLMTQRRLAENLLATLGGERRLTDFMHVSELLQEASLELESEHALVRWLSQQIMQPDLGAEHHQLRLESDQHLVKIITIHKSKGLEYPLVCLPFLSIFRQQKQPRYHDRDDFSAIVDLQASEEALALAEEERLAEDLRLLYVGLTRAIYHCCVGIAPLTAGNRRGAGQTDVHRSALGYLLQQGQAGDAQWLKSSLNQLSQTNVGIGVKLVNDSVTQTWQGTLNLAQPLAAKQFQRRLVDNWRVTSYSALQHTTSPTPYLANLSELLPNMDVDTLGEGQLEQQVNYSSHTFAKGAAAGTFLHSLLEPLDFTRPIDAALLQQQMQQHGIDEIWFSTLKQWLEDIVSSPLNTQGLTLSQITPGNKQAELQFYLPINRQLDANTLDLLVKSYDPLSAHCPVLDFQQLQGMLKGFIDLVFCWQGRYYLADYKSNWLGNHTEAYTPQGINQAMAEHRYDLQYQLYSLALHRYLRHRISHYDYHQHFGGVFYLFLRGMQRGKPGQGVFYHQPALELIDGLDRLFTGNDGK